MKILTLFLLVGITSTINGQQYKKSDLTGQWYLINQKLEKNLDTLTFKRVNSESAFTVWNFNNDTVSISTGHIIDFEENRTNNDKIIVIDEQDYYQLTGISYNDNKASIEISDGKSNDKYAILFLNENNLSMTKKE